MVLQRLEDAEPGAVKVEGRGSKVWTILLDRPERKNAVNGDTARKLYRAFVEFENDPVACVAVLHGRNQVFCAGADLTEMSNPIISNVRDIGPMGISRLILSKPVIAAVEGFCVAGGLELACWCDMRVASETATFGVFCRRWGVPLIDGGTVRLPRIIGQSRAIDMILTGRAVNAHEALAFGLANRVVPTGTALKEALDLARDLAELPQNCMRNDRLSALEQWSFPEATALANEFGRGLSSLRAEAISGAAKFKGGAGRKGSKL